ncbi:MAG: hypothetical protein ACAI44_32600 [Candidatus Sericytochromatia bacterium]
MKRAALGFTVGLTACLLAACNPLSNTLSLPPEPGNMPAGQTPMPAGRVQGESKTFMNQTVTSWVKLNGETIEETGFTLPVALVEATSTDAKSAPFSIKLELPDVVQSKTVVDNVSIDYLAGGHPPPGVYDKPHFDVHFYFNPDSVNAKVDCSDKTQAAADRVPPPYMFFPPDAPECVPTMGFHGIDPRSPELAQQNPAPFTKTMILGFYGGKQVFIEPMVTREFLLKKEGFSIDVLKGTVVDKPGLYPSKAVLRMNAAGTAYELVLTEFK